MLRLALPLASMTLAAVLAGCGAPTHTAAPFTKASEAVSAQASTATLRRQLMTNLRKNFAYADLNADGRLDVQEAARLGMKPHQFPEWDKNGDGTVEFEELITPDLIASTIQGIRRTAHRVTYFFDRDGDNRLSRDEYLNSGLDFTPYPAVLNPDPNVKEGAFDVAAGADRLLSKWELETLLGNVIEQGYGYSVLYGNHSPDPETSFKMMDTNLDKVIDFEEYVADGIPNPGETPQQHRERLMREFIRLDRNLNGRVTLKEYLKNAPAEAVSN